MKNTMAIVFAYQRSEQMKALTTKRSLPSVPIGGRYRLIDFALSNLVNSGITKVGIITRDNYQSLIDHVGNGKEWDLSRKRDGLYLIPPYSYAAAEGAQEGEIYRGKMEALMNAETFIRKSEHEYVILSTANSICNMTYDDALAFHQAKGADITIIYKKGIFDRTEAHTDSNCFLFTDDDGRVTDVSIDPVIGREKLSMGQMIIGKSLLESLIWECHNNGAYSLHRDVLQKKLQDLKIYGYEYTGYWEQISSILSYFKANMALLDNDTRVDLFYKENKIFTKTRDEIPTRYLEGAKVQNSLISDGCIIEGVVENSVLSRGVHVRPGAVVKNCVIMQDCEIQEGARLEYVVADKDVVIREDSKVIRRELYPMVIPKGTVV